MQLRALAVLIAFTYPQVRDVTVAIIQPYASPSLSLALYDHDDLDRAREEVFHVVAQIEAPYAPRHPGDHCKYCRALSICPEANRQALELARVAPKEIAEYDDNALWLLLSRVSLVEDVIEAAKSEARRRLESGESSRESLGWELVPGAPREKITDVSTVFARAAKTYGVAASTFAEHCSVTKRSLKALVSEVTTIRGKALDAAVARLIDGLTEETVPQPSLRRVTK
jgi:hypothetical protein